MFGNDVDGPEKVLIEVVQPKKQVLGLPGQNEFARAFLMSVLMISYIVRQ